MYKRRGGPAVTECGLGENVVVGEPMEDSKWLEEAMCNANSGWPRY